MLGLVIREPWISLILNGQKTWEIRGRNCRIRVRMREKTRYKVLYLPVQR